MTDEQNATLTALFEAVKAYDSDALLPLFTQDATVIQPERPVYQGQDGVTQMVNDLARTWTDFKPEPSRTIANGDSAAVEWSCTITDFGGGQARVDGCAVVDFQGGKIRRLRMYWRPEDMRS